MARDEKAYEALERRALGEHLTADFDRVLDRQRAGLEKTFTERHGRLLAMTALFKETLLDLRNRGWNTHAELWNIGIYINIVTHDLSVLLWQLCIERDIWARKLAARHVALLVFEVTEDATQLLGGPIRGALSQLGVMERYDPTLRAARAPLDAFMKQHSGAVNNIRNLAGAHRDHDGLLLLNSIETIDIEQIQDLGLKLGKILNDLGPMLQEMFTETSMVAPPELGRPDEPH